MQQSEKNRPNRRQFLANATTAMGGLIVGPTIITSSALGANGQLPASERIVMGTIGLGGRGCNVMGAFLRERDVQMVAVCDVKAKRRRIGKTAVDKKYGNKDCKSYIDLHEFLARKDIDAVLIATGDNWHSLASCLAARAGKDMYCEKPLSVAITESRAVAETMRRYARVFQCGTQRRSVEHFVFAVNLARRGLLGKLRNVYAEKAPYFIDVHENVLPEQSEPAREEMDWDRWLGPAPWRPYNGKYHSRGFWSGHLDFSGGSITEWGSHTIDLCQWANDADTTAPIEYEPAGKDGKDITAHYANGVKLFVRQGLRFGTCPVRFEGEDGWVETGDSGEMETHPASLMRGRQFRKGYPVDNHVRNFLDCVKTRQQPVSNADVAHHSITACHAANICMRLGRKVKWDPANETFIADEEANRLRSRAYREPWRL
ncbi:MAG: Gfo/Idh/MocA family oxidoreductase [Sedimentisphaerales bacterium]|nr:Gfo/Idh/MocA family oxidoreductase [Sedimentisphaerales bacterium]